MGIMWVVSGLNEEGMPDSEESLRHGFFRNWWTGQTVRLPTLPFKLPEGMLYSAGVPPPLRFFWGLFVVLLKKIAAIRLNSILTTFFLTFTFSFQEYPSNYVNC